MADSVRMGNTCSRGGQPNNLGWFYCCHIQESGAWKKYADRIRLRKLWCHLGSGRDFCSNANCGGWGNVVLCRHWSGITQEVLGKARGRADQNVIGENWGLWWRWGRHWGLNLLHWTFWKIFYFGNFQTYTNVVTDNRMNPHVLITQTQQLSTQTNMVSSIPLYTPVLQPPTSLDFIEANPRHRIIASINTSKSIFKEGRLF